MNAAREQLDQRLLAAHAANDRMALVSLYSEAAQAALDDTAHGFYLTHAYVFALEMGHPRTGALHDQLKRLGRED